MSYQSLRWKQLGSLVLIACFAQMASDIYAPSLPLIARDLGVAIGQVQQSLSIFMAALAASQLVYGPLSDRFGRQKILMLGCAIAMLGSVMAYCAGSLSALWLARLVQGTGAGACACIWRAVFRDWFCGEDLSRYAAYFVLLILCIVPAAPLCGAYLAQYVGWRANFAFLLAYAVLALVVLRLGFRDSAGGSQPRPCQGAALWHGYAQLLRSRYFLSLTGATFLCYGAYFSWFVYGPVLLHARMAQPATTFGWLTGVGGGVCYALAARCNSRWIKHLGMVPMLLLAFGIMFAASLLLLVLSGFIPLGLVSLAMPMLLFWFGVGLVWPNANALAMGPFGQIAGSAAALYGCMQLGGAACMAELISWLPHDRLWPWLSLMLLAPALSWLLLCMGGVRSEQRGPWPHRLKDQPT